jgi:hypothetical protein
MEMPYQLKGQLVLTKSQRLLHTADVDVEAFVAATGGCALVTVMSSADTSAARAALASARIAAGETPNLFMLHLAASRSVQV